MIYLNLFMAFFIPNIIGYGGGPAIIPLIEAEVVGKFGWMTSASFAETLAIGNALPSPIATKMAGQIGYEMAGSLGALVAVFATVAPSLLLMITALGVVYRFRNSLQVKRMSQWVRPVIVVMMGMLVLSFLQESLAVSGAIHTFMLGALSVVAFTVLRLHPAVVVSSSLVYGAVFLGS